MDHIVANLGYIAIFIGSFLGLLLGPATLAAAFLDLIFKSGSHGSRFYRVLDWGRRCDGALGLYAALHRKYEGIKVEDGTPSKHIS